MDAKASSIIVEGGKKCTFFTQYGCSGAQKLEFGDKGQALGYGVLPSMFDKKIHSVYCSTI